MAGGRSRKLRDHTDKVSVLDSIIGFSTNAVNWIKPN